ncbi:MAG: peptide chain release factor 2 [Eubacteriales bacterium]|nr:peptide chain release factor 2 [Eubacteriales bacterium]MDD4474551.1 peptide chain release factor 2 [Eubacteriales bacterium]
MYLLIQLEQSRVEIDTLAKNIDDLGAVINLTALEEEINKLQQISEKADFWDDPMESRNVLKTLKIKKDSFENYKELKKGIQSIIELTDLAIEEDDASLVEEILKELDDVTKEYEKQKIEVLLNGEYDHSNAILTIHPGAGGTEAQDWAEMLYRMYTRFAERRKYKVKVLDYLDGDEAGIKSVSILIEGDNAYGYLHGENGVHRLVRVSPFNSQGKRQTSFASVEVMPEFNDEIAIELKDEDLRIDTHRSSGAGGQHVNKTDSAIRITHLPTGIVVGCQTERSQMQNKETALKMLKSKLLEIKERENLEKIEDIKGDKMNIEWGSQIRSYVFMPYTLVKDTRTQFESTNIGAVMDGEIDGFLNAYLSQKKSK